MKNEWWETTPWLLWADLFVGKYTDPAYVQTEKQVDFIESSIPLKKNFKILDLPCGNGRHSIELIQRGYNVIGVDYSKETLDRAREDARIAGVNLKLYESDMRDINWANEFDVLLNLFQSFGYFKTQEEDEKVLRIIYKALKKGGRLLLDVRNPEYIFPLIRKNNNAVFKPSYMLPDNYIVDIEESIKEDRWIVKINWRIKSKIVRTKWSIRLYTRNELIRMFQDTGFTIENTWGNYDIKERFKTSSPRIIILARK